MYENLCWVCPDRNLERTFETLDHKPEVMCLLKNIAILGKFSFSLNFMSFPIFWQWFTFEAFEQVIVPITIKTGPQGMRIIAVIRNTDKVDFRLLSHVLQVKRKQLKLATASECYTLYVLLMKDNSK